ncbi:MAG: pitrilysin family protein [Thermoplasmata archaeon]
MPAAVRPLRRVTESFRLDNGLRVLLAHQPASPTASVWLWYRVGSRNESPGRTGASHWVEHMLFQGSPRFPKGAIDRAVTEVGGMANAFTSSDFTAYFTTVPREHVGLPLAIEVDRLTGATIEDAEVDRERRVVLSERDGNENWPEFRAEEEMFATMFRRHPYRWDTLGHREDIERMDGTALREYYHRYYGPRNATLVVAGAFDPAQRRREIERAFGDLPATGEDPRVDVKEPPLTELRTSEIRGPGSAPLLLIGYRVPGIADERTPAIALLDAVLGGECRLFEPGIGGGRPDEHPTSRLYRGLVDRGLAVRAVSDWQPRVDPSVLLLRIQAAPRTPLARLQEATDRLVGRLREEGPTPQELGAIRARLARIAPIAYEGASRTGFRLGLWDAWGSPELEARWFRALRTTGRHAVHAAAQEILDPDRRVIVRYLPVPPGHFRRPG